jgi:predicted PurR-regulated permease PerM
MRPTPSLSESPAERPLTRGDLVRASLLVIFTLVALQLLWSARILVLTSFLGILFGLSAARATDYLLTKVKARREVVAAFVVLGVTGLLILIFAWSGPTLIEQSQDLKTKLPEAIEKLEVWVSVKQPDLLNAIAPPDSLGGSRIGAAVSKHAPALTNFAFGFLQSTLVVAAGLVMVVFLALYIAADPHIYRRGFLMLVPIARRERFGSLLTALAFTLRTWFATQLIAMLVIGVVTTIVLALLGVRAALPLGVIAGIFEFVPNIGPLLSAIPAILMAFVDSPQKAMLVVGVYWAIQFLENNLLIPYLMKEQLNIPPAMTLLAQVLMAYVFGFLGLFVAIPLLASAIVTVRTFWVEDDLPPLPTFAAQHAGNPTPGDGSSA